MLCWFVGWWRCVARGMDCALLLLKRLESESCATARRNMCWLGVSDDGSEWFCLSTMIIHMDIHMPDVMHPAGTVVVVVVVVLDGVNITSVLTLAHKWSLLMIVWVRRRVGGLGDGF